MYCTVISFLFLSLLFPVSALMTCQTPFPIQLLTVLHYLHWNSTELFAPSGKFTK